MKIIDPNRAEGEVILTEGKLLSRFKTLCQEATTIDIATAWANEGQHLGVPINASQEKQFRLLAGLNSYITTSYGSCDKAGVKGFGSHALLRFIASTLAGKHEFSTPTIQFILGHEKVTTTELYIQNIRNDVRQAMDMLAEGQDWTLAPEVKKEAEYPESTPLDVLSVPSRI